MSLRDTFTQIPPREKSGATTSDRYDYQKNWSLMTLLEHHLTGCDYLFVFDFHEDMLVFDSEDSPDKVSFYQVKTNDTGKNWKLPELINAKKKKKVDSPSLSFIGKLYQNKINHPNNTMSLNFVSNAKFDVTLADSTKSTDRTTICCSDLDAGLIDQIGNKLIEEHNLQSEPDFKGITFLKVSGLSLDDHSSHIRGKLADFLEQLLPGKKYVAGAVYKSLYSEINRKTNYNKHIKTFDEMIINKAIGRKYFQEHLNKIGLIQDYDEIWNTIEGRLNVENVPLNLIKSIKTNWMRFETDRMDKTNIPLDKLCSEISQIVLSLMEGATGLIKLMTDAESKLDKANSDFKLYSSDYIKAVILATYYEN